MTVTVYARHSMKCSKSREKNAGQYKRCKCNLWLQWNKDGEQFKKSAKTRSWDIATKAARKLEGELEREAIGGFRRIPSPRKNLGQAMSLPSFFSDFKKEIYEQTTYK